jgi:hypothetical protein
VLDGCRSVVPERQDGWRGFWLYRAGFGVLARARLSTPAPPSDFSFSFGPYSLLSLYREVFSWVRLLVLFLPTGLVSSGLVVVVT